MEPIKQQRLQSLADQNRLSGQHIETARRSVTPNNSNIPRSGPRDAQDAAEIACSDSPDNETEFFVGEEHSPDSQISQGYKSSKYDGVIH